MNRFSDQRLVFHFQLIDHFRGRPLKMRSYFVSMLKKKPSRMRGLSFLLTKKCKRIDVIGSNNMKPEYWKLSLVKLIPLFEFQLSPNLSTWIFCGVNVYVIVSHNEAIFLNRNIIYDSAVCKST